MTGTPPDLVRPCSAQLESLNLVALPGEVSTPPPRPRPFCIHSVYRSGNNCDEVKLRFWWSSPKARGTKVKAWALARWLSWLEMTNILLNKPWVQRWNHKWNTTFLLNWQNLVEKLKLDWREMYSLQCSYYRRKMVDNYFNFYLTNIGKRT